MLNKDEEHLLLSHIDDLCKEANNKQYVTNSDFLTLQESSLVSKHLTKVNQTYEFVGGYDDAERLMVLIVPNDGQSFLPKREDLMTYLSIEPKSLKFGRKLNHRDYLGALMNLGIDRKVLGDLLMDGQSCTLICLKHMTEFIMKNLLQVRHAGVTITEIDSLADYLGKRSFKRISNTVASLRIDGVMKVCVRASRQDCQKLIQSGHVFVNGVEVHKGSHQIELDDIIVVRGHGKFKMVGIGNLTKKNRTFIDIDQYV